MTSILSGPQKPDTSKQEELLAKQEAEAKEQKRLADAEQERLRDERIASQKRSRGRLQGRQSLIKTSELGVDEDLG